MILLLLLSTMGIAVSKHYCGENLVSVSFFDEANKCCDDGDCCHNDNLFFQVNDDFSVPSVSNLPYLAAFEIPKVRLCSDFQLKDFEKASAGPNISDLLPALKSSEALSLRQVYLL